MKTFTLSLFAAATAAVLAFGPAAPALAQDEAPPAVADHHGDWTLNQREDWLKSRLDKARDEGAIDHHEFDRVKQEINDIHGDADKMRDHHGGQLTDNENADLEGRLDRVAEQIHWLHENSFQRPW